MSRIIVDSVRKSSASSDGITLANDGSVTFPGNATCSGTATGFGGGKLLQVIQTEKNDTTSTSSTSWSDITGMSVTITPSSSSSKIFVETRFKAAAGDVVYIALTTGDGTPIIQASGSGFAEKPAISIYSGGNSSGESWYNGDMSTVCKLHSPNTTSAVTYKLRWRVNSNTAYLNRNMDMGGQYNAPVASTITVMEIGA